MAELAIVNGYDIRDRKLADAAVDTSVGTNDYVMVETSNGNYIKIGKENFTKSVREILGTIIYNQGGDKGTSVSHVPALDSNHDLGMTSVANLASVLGVAFAYNKGISIDFTKNSFISARDLNNIRGFTGIKTGLLNLWGGGWSNLPSGITQQIAYLITIDSGWIGTAQILVC